MSLRRGKFDGSRVLPDGSLMEITKVYPLDAVFDSPEEVPEDIKANKRYAGSSNWTVQEVAESVKKDFGSIDILVHSLANGPEVTKPLLETSRKGYLAAVSASSYSYVSLLKHFLPIMYPAYRGLGESVASAAKAFQANNAAITFASFEGITSEFKLMAASTIATGILLGTYEDNRFRSESKKPTIKSVEFLGFGTRPELEKKLKYTEDVCTRVILGKELVNSSANVLTPGVLAQEAEKIASTYSDVFTAKILDTEQCKELKMGSYLGVAAASANPPKFIHLCYKPPSGPVKKKLALVVNEKSHYYHFSGRKYFFSNKSMSKKEFMQHVYQ